MGTRLIVFGDVIDDIVVVPSGPIRADTDTPSTISHRPGGSAANAASWMGFRGAAVDFVGRVAASDVARHEQVLADFGVTPHLSGDAELPTGAIVVLVDGGLRSMLTQRGANEAFSADEVTDALLADAAAVHFTGYSVFGSEEQGAIARLFARARVAGAAVSVDPASAGGIIDCGADRFLKAVAGATLLLPNLEEGRALTGLQNSDAIAQKLSESFPLVALTMGDAGVIVAKQGEAPVRIEAVPSVSVDPTGAGDAFTAGFLSEWALHGDPIAAARVGVDVAAQAVAAIGARPPTL